jgi:hypothetical protein
VSSSWSFRAHDHSVAAAVVNFAVRALVVIALGVRTIGIRREDYAASNAAAGSSLLSPKVAVLLARPKSLSLTDGVSS